MGQSERLSLAWESQRCRIITFWESGCKTKIIVGGAPFRFDSRLWEEVGADAVGIFASEAPGLVDKLAECPTIDERGGRK